MNWTELEAAIGGALGRGFSITDRTPVGGGCISEAWRLDSGAGPCFLKTGPAGAADAFAAEADGLAALAAGGLRVPGVLAGGETGDRAWLLLEYLELRGLDRAAGARLGEALAALHGEAAGSFGWHRDNYIGSTPQANGELGDWVALLRERRLGPQLALAAGRGAPAGLVAAGERLLEALPAFFADYDPHPVLLHGDLWGGNAAALGDGTPVLFDPAIYRGDREADLAMTELFGGFPPAFYEAYDAALPRDPGYATRRELYNLYHLLNHHNLFGGGYGRQALASCKRLLAAVR
ncbi:MAG: fructosamine kinase family protein [Pseudohaliea sp.]